MLGAEYTGGGDSGRPKRAIVKTPRFQHPGHWLLKYPMRCTCMLRGCVVTAEVQNPKRKSVSTKAERTTGIISTKGISKKQKRAKGRLTTKQKQAKAAYDKERLDNR